MENLLDEIASSWRVESFKQAEPQDRDAVLNRLAQRGEYRTLETLAKEEVDMSGLDENAVAEGIASLLSRTRVPTDGIKALHKLMGRDPAVPEEIIALPCTHIHVATYIRLLDVGDVDEALKLHQIYPLPSIVVADWYRLLLEKGNFRGARKVYEGTGAEHNLSDAEIQHWYEKLVKGPNFFEARRLKKTAPYIFDITERAHCIEDLFEWTKRKPSSIPAQELEAFYHQLSKAVSHGYKYDLIARMERILPPAPATLEMLEAAARNGDIKRVKRIAEENPGLATKYPELKAVA